MAALPVRQPKPHVYTIANQSVAWYVCVHRLTAKTVVTFQSTEVFCSSYPISFSFFSFFFSIKSTMHCNEMQCNAWIDDVLLQWRNTTTKTSKILCCSRSFSKHTKCTSCLTALSTTFWIEVQYECYYCKKKKQQKKTICYFSTHFSTHTHTDTHFAGALNCLATHCQILQYPSTHNVLSRMYTCLRSKFVLTCGIFLWRHDI